MPGLWGSLPAHPKGAFGTPRPATRRTGRPDVSYGTVSGSRGRPPWTAVAGRAASYAGSDAASATPAAFAASRTAPATAPATLSLKTDGMM